MSSVAVDENAPASSTAAMTAEDGRVILVTGSANVDNVVLSTRVKTSCNLAIVKYWGKRDKDLNLPINSSVSVTLDRNDLCTVTCVAASKSFDKDRLWLNGEEEGVGGTGAARS